MIRIYTGNTNTPRMPFSAAGEVDRIAHNPRSGSRSLGDSVQTVEQTPQPLRGKKGAPLNRVLGAPTTSECSPSRSAFGQTDLLCMSRRHTITFIVHCSDICLSSLIKTPSLLQFEFIPKRTRRQKRFHQWLFLGFVDATTCPAPRSRNPGSIFYLFYVQSFDETVQMPALGDGSTLVSQRRFITCSNRHSETWSGWIFTIAALLGYRPPNERLYGKAIS